MQINNWNYWKYVYKKNYGSPGPETETNLAYTPLVSPDYKIFCMNFDHTSDYQNIDVQHIFPSRPNYTAEAVTFFFEREIFYRDKFKKYSWAPTYVYDDLQNQRIFFNWPGMSCNKWVVENTIDEHCPDWEDQLLQIVYDLLDAGCYKTTFYPHCFFVEDGVLKTFDFFGCTDIDNHVLPMKHIEAILTPSKREILADVIVNNTIDTKIVFKQALEGNSNWGSKKLEELAREIF